MEVIGLAPPLHQAGQLYAGASSYSTSAIFFIDDLLYLHLISTCGHPFHYLMD